MKPLVLLRKAHKWLGLIIGLQLLFWVVGGLVMSALSLDEVHGDHLHHTPETLPLNASLLDKVAGIIESRNIDAKAISVQKTAVAPVLTVSDVASQTHYFNLITGQPLTSISETQARKIATTLYAGNGDVESIEKINKASTEYRKELPAWRVNFDDSEGTSFYLHTLTGELQSVRNDRWRIFDFVWTLHIMDYEDRTDFNHPLLIIAAALALLLVLAGIYLVFKTFRKRDFGLKG